MDYTPSKDFRFTAVITSANTYSYLHRVFMSDEANFRCPAVARNNGGNKYESLVIGGI